LFLQSSVIAKADHEAASHGRTFHECVASFCGLAVLRLLRGPSLEALDS
jgi:hypothetical protein